MYVCMCVCIYVIVCMHVCMYMCLYLTSTHIWGVGSRLLEAQLVIRFGWLFETFVVGALITKYHCLCLCFNVEFE